MKLLNIILSILLIGLVAANTSANEGTAGKTTDVNRKQQKQPLKQQPDNNHSAEEKIQQATPSNTMSSTTSTTATPAPVETMPKPLTTTSCYSTVFNECTKAVVPNPDDDFPHCDSTMGLFDVGGLQDYTYHQLISSYDYILLFTVFSSYEKDRPGFAKIFRDRSDKAFDNTIKLIKYITSRGGVVDFSKLPNSTASLDLNELHALAWALDKEKELSQEVSDHHKKVSGSDPLTTQFLEEEFLEDQIKTIRKLSGHVNDLKKIMLSSKDDTALGVHLFDEYLQKL